MSDENEINNNIIPFPGGKSVDPSEVGVDEFVAVHVGSVPTSELIDPLSIDKDIKERMEYVDSQELVRAVKSNSSTTTTIDILLLELAEESSHLKWERRNLAKKGKSTAQLTVARMASLKQLADTLIKRKEAGFTERVTIKDPRIQKLFSIWMDMFYSCLEKSSVSPEVIDIVFNQMKADMVEWEVKMLSLD